MREPKPIRGGRALLFERLADAEPLSPEEEARPLRAHDESALRESVRGELSRLLNTRRHTTPLGAAAGAMTVLDYGLPDFSSLSAAAADDRSRLAAEVAAAVTAFEPRLREVRVRVESPEPGARSLALRLDAVLAVGLVAEPVSFPLYLRTKAAEAEVHHAESE